MSRDKIITITEEDHKDIIHSAYYRGLKAGTIFGLAVGLGSWGLNALTIYIMSL